MGALGAGKILAKGRSLTSVIEDQVRAGKGREEECEEEGTEAGDPDYGASLLSCSLG